MSCSRLYRPLFYCHCAPFTNNTYCYLLAYCSCTVGLARSLCRHVGPPSLWFIIRDSWYSVDATLTVIERALSELGTTGLIELPRKAKLMHR